MLALVWSAAVLCAWSVSVPWLGEVLGLGVEVATSIEIVDHVVPGLAGIAAAAVMVAPVRRGESGTPALLLASGVLALAGLWMTATHVPLLLQAARGFVPWPNALWHSAGGPLVLALGVALFLYPAGEKSSPPS